MFLAGGIFQAATYYVAPNGNNNAAGTLSQPFAALQKANDVVRAEDTVYIRGGTYRITAPYNSGAGIALTRSGASDANRIYYWAYPGETPVFDFSNMQISTTGYTSGFSANHSSGGNTWYNNTFYNNGRQYDMWASTWDAQGNRTDGVILTGDKRHIMRNNIGFPNNNRYIDGYGVDTEFNSWDLNITPSESDFLSVSDAGFMGPRKPDGSLPDIPFLKLHPNSRFIDKGTDVSLPYEGASPDLGAYEFSEVTPVPFRASRSLKYSILRKGDYYEIEVSGVANRQDAYVEVFNLLGTKTATLPIVMGKARWRAPGFHNRMPILKISSGIN